MKTRRRPRKSSKHPQKKSPTPKSTTSSWKRGATAAGIAASTLWAPPSDALAEEISADISAYLSYTFGGKDTGFGWGLEARGLYRDEMTWCGSDETIRQYGGALRFAWLGWSQPRLAVAAQGGIVFGQYYATHGEVGMGYRWGDHEGIESLVGAELSYLTGAARIQADPVRKELSLEGAFRIPPLGYGGAFGCAVEGRALRTDEGIATLPEVNLMGPATNHNTIADPERDAVVAIWSGRTQREWASVPAFIQLAEQLATCHAPGSLINRALRAGDDEVRHAVLSGGIASYYDGGSIYADGASHETRLPVANRDGLRRLAVESWLDGCIGEGTAAAFAAQEAKTTEVNAIRNTQQMIAEDEAQHAELAWDVLDWTLEVGGDDIRQLVWELRDTLPPSVEEAQTDMSLRRYGCLSYDTQKSVLARHHEHAQKRLAAVLAA